MNIAHSITVLRDHPRPARLIAARLLALTGLSPLFTIPLNGYSLRFYPTNVSANLWINPASRFHDLALFEDYCAPGDVVIDVGANIGEVAIVCGRRVGAAGRVLAFEPHPRIYRYLLGNLELNGCANVIGRNLALGRDAGPVRLSDDRRDDMNRIDAAGPIAITGSTLDREAPPQPIALLKIDVEGAELAVLEGGVEAVARTACVNCELIDAHCRRYGHTPSDVIAWLRTRGFETFLVETPRRLRSITSNYAQPGSHELLGVRDVNDFVRRTGWEVV